MTGYVRLFVCLSVRNVNSWAAFQDRRVKFVVKIPISIIKSLEYDFIIMYVCVCVCVSVCV